MHVIEPVADMRDARGRLAGIVGLVPTMGALHGGHEELLRRARENCDAVVVSIFVNPRQFGPGEDYEAYPRDTKGDLEICRRCGVDIVLAPAVAEIYPPGDATTVNPGPLGDILEGAHRPGHFAGVATVVTKLFNIVRPHRAYFGRKDAQQLRVIERIVEDLRLDVTIVPVPTVRDDDGLALSSRNAYLDPAERRAATVLFRALQDARQRFAAGERDGDRLRDTMRSLLDGEPLADPEYVEVVDPATFEPLARAAGPALACLAVRFGPARLIDNLRLDDEVPR
jgi:pantoate--beta-alanine ligase